MLTKRIIACLDVRDGAVVKGVHFRDLAHAGDPATLAARYDAEGVDELVMLDVSATLEGRRARAVTIGRIAAAIRVPLTVGGGIRTLDDARAAFDAGADKVALNSAALATPDLITSIARRYGSQAAVTAIDAQWDGDRAVVLTRSGTATSTREAVEWAREAEARGAGEILLTSIDRDGTRGGFDTRLTSAVSAAVSIPVIASGGAGEAAHFLAAFTEGRADAALAASIFHYGDVAIPSLKQWLADRGVPMRLTEASTC